MGAGEQVGIYSRRACPLVRVSLASCWLAPFHFFSQVSHSRTCTQGV